MKYVIYMLLLFLCGYAVQAQQSCALRSALFSFDDSKSPTDFTNRLGEYPQFNFLQKMRLKTGSAEEVYKVIQDEKIRRRNPRTFAALDILLQEIGFPKGCEEVAISNIVETTVDYGITGNLGYYARNKDTMDYAFVKLLPHGENIKGIPAWRIMHDNGCYFYILKTCGNAFYPKPCPSGDCPTIWVNTMSDTLELRGGSAQAVIRIHVGHYEGVISNCRKRRRIAKQQGTKGSRVSVSDTTIHQLCQKDTVISIAGLAGYKYKVWNVSENAEVKVCNDSTITIKTKLGVDSLHNNEIGDVSYTINDTCYRKDCPGCDCAYNWEIGINAGVSFNSIPRYDNTTVHTRTDGAHFVGEIHGGKVLSPWFTLGLSVMYLKLSYQDDVAYAGTVPGTYNTVLVGNPMIPVQVYGKATIGCRFRWQSIVSLSAGMAFPGEGKIENEGQELSAKPDVKAGFTAGLRLGVNYRISYNWFASVSFTGQYFGSKVTGEGHRLFALPIMGGVRYQF